MALCLKPVNPVSFPLGVIQIPEGRSGVYLGRDSRNDAQVDVEAVSSRHAQLLLNSDGVLEVRDFDSSNGTFVNGVRIQKQALNEGDTVKFAMAAFSVVEFDEEAVPGAPLAGGVPLPPVAVAEPSGEELTQPGGTAPTGPSEAELAAKAEALTLPSYLVI